MNEIILKDIELLAKKYDGVPLTRYDLNREQYLLLIFAEPIADYIICYESDNNYKLCLPNTEYTIRKMDNKCKYTKLDMIYYADIGLSDYFGIYIGMKINDTKFTLVLKQTVSNQSLRYLNDNNFCLIGFVAKKDCNFVLRFRNKVILRYDVKRIIFNGCLKIVN